MNNLVISTDPALLDVELPRTLIESASVSTFLPEEEASICPLLSTTNGTSTPITFSHPLTPCIDNDSNTSANLCNEEDVTKAETSSSSRSSSGIGMDAPDTTATLFNKHAYQHLQDNNCVVQDTNGHGINGNLALTNNTPSFVSWNWPFIRKCTFFVFMSSLLAMCAVVVAMIITLPKTCNPKTAWYRGGVFYEIFPASFQDSNNDGMGDIRGIIMRVDYLTSLGVSAVRLNSIFPSSHYPEDFENVTSLKDVAKALGSTDDLLQLVAVLHARNISLILDLPIDFYVKELNKTSFILENEQLNSTFINVPVTTISTPTTSSPISSQNLVSSAIRKWIDVGVDGFYFKGLEHFVNNENLVWNIAEWKHLLGPNRVLIVSETFINDLDADKQYGVLMFVDLVDVHLDVLNGTRHMEERIQRVLTGPLAPIDKGVWIHWSIAAAGRPRIHYHNSVNISLAATLMQLMLPGTPNIFYGNEIALQITVDHHVDLNETKHLHHLLIMQWPNSTIHFTNRETLPWLTHRSTCTYEHFEIIANMIRLRDRSPSIYKNAICKPETQLSNTQVRRSHDDILVVERDYPRRNTFVAVSNFGQAHVSMDMTSMYYSGVEMIPKADGEKVYFGAFEIDPLETIVVKLDK